MAGVILIKAADRGDRLGRLAIRKQTTATGNYVAEARVLQDDRTPQSEIPRTAITEPTAPRAYIAMLGDAELALRAQSGIADRSMDLARSPEDQQAAIRRLQICP